MIKNALPVFVGYDDREDEAYQVCRHSILRRSDGPIHVIPLREEGLRRAGLYRRNWYMNDDGHRIDSLDKRPFSTQFAFTRFLVPALMQYEGWAVFCDCDFLFTLDIRKLLTFADPDKAVMVVQHDTPHREGVKMDGQLQQAYPRKNWSSLMLFNCDHPAHRKLTVDAVNCEPGSWLHRFEWLRDDEIGKLPATWNHLVGVVPWQGVGFPAGVHYTLGGPWFPNCRTTPFANLWLQERELAYGSKRGITHG